MAGIMIIFHSNTDRNFIFALIIFLPFSYFLLKNWLNDFAYRISLSSWYFIIAAGLVVMIAALTVASQTLKALRNRPVKSLRSE